MNESRHGRLGRTTVDQISALTSDLVVLQAGSVDSEDPPPPYQPGARFPNEPEPLYRYRIVYEAVGHAIEHPEFGVNLTRLYDWLGGEDIPPESILCVEGST